jgi:hypothetical protein
MGRVPAWWAAALTATTVWSASGCAADGGASADVEPPAHADPTSGGVDSGAGATPGETPAPASPAPVDNAPVPLAGPTNQWTWHDVPGAVCGDGSPTGLGVNVGTGNDLVIFMMGGGICFDELSCAGSSHLGVPLATYVLNGFHEPDFQALVAGKGAVPIPVTGSIIDRNDVANPYRNSTFVLVPYCTGDLHTGSTTQQWIGLTRRTMHYAGHTNFQTFLSQIVPSFPTPSRVTLLGSSAGAFGATIQFERVKNAFPNTRVDLVADSGPWFHAPLMPIFESGMNLAWNSANAIPDGCPACKSDINAIYAYDSAIAPDSRLAFLSHDQDQLISMADLMPGYPIFYFALKDLTLGTIGPNKNWRYFVAGGTDHTLLGNLGTTSASEWAYACDQSFLGICLRGHNVAVNPTTLGTWLTQMTTDDPNWTSMTTITQ